jgi:D-glycero-D-manno-heptose 1,7-bisphosphate phosphatase
MVKLNKAVFLDRDGVINRERGEYTYKVEDFEILPSVIPTLKKIQELGYKIIIITNQGGIAKGIYTHNDVLLAHQYLQKELENNSVYLTDIFYSPHHQDYSRSLDRKPDSLMLEKAMAIYKIDPENSVMIGDSERDIVASEKVGVKGFLITPNSSINFILNHLK